MKWKTFQEEKPIKFEKIWIYWINHMLEDKIVLIESYDIQTNWEHIGWTHWKRFTKISKKPKPPKQKMDKQ